MLFSIRSVFTPILLSSTIALSACGGSSSSSSPTTNAITPSESVSNGQITDPATLSDQNLDSTNIATANAGEELVTSHTAPPDIAGGNYFLGGTNSAILTGEPIGTGQFSNASQVKDIPFVRPIQLDPALEILKVTLMKESETKLSGMATIRNNGNEILCDLLPSFLYILKDGSKLGDGDRGWYPKGELSDWIHPDDGEFSTEYDCVYPGSIFYHSGTVRSDEDISFDTIDHFTFFNFRYFNDAESRRELATTRSRLIPKSYRLTNNDDGVAVVELTISNEGQSTLRFTGCTIILLDEDGYPLGEESSGRSQILSVGNVSPGTTFTAHVWDRFTQGQSATLRARCTARPATE